MVPALANGLVRKPLGVVQDFGCGLDRLARRLRLSLEHVLAIANEHQAGAKILPCAARRCAASPAAGAFGGITVDASTVETTGAGSILLQGRGGNNAITPMEYGVLVEAGCEIARELYLGIVIDRAAAMPVLMASSAGGMNIEDVAAKTPELIFKEPFHPDSGLQPYQVRKLCAKN